MSLFEKIKLGLEQALAYERGEIEARVSRGYVAPLEKFTAEEIKEIRKSTGLTQWLFAKYMGVSVKTVEAWEAGRNAPNGTACRMLAITKANPAFPSEMKIIDITPPRSRRKKPKAQEKEFKKNSKTYTFQEVLDGYDKKKS